MEHSSNLTTGELVGIGLRGFVCLVGLPGNIMVVVFLLRHFKKENFTLHLMLYLAVSDILCILTLPVWMYDLLFEWTMDIAACHAVCYIAFVCLSVSVMSVTLMSLQRYLLVLYRRQWDRLGRRGEGLLLVSICIISCFAAIPSVSMFEIIEVQSVKKCERVSRSVEKTVGFFLLETLFAFVVPFVVLVVSYFNLHRKVCRKTQHVSGRLGKLVTAIVVTFFILNFPYHIVNIMTIFVIKPSHLPVTLPYLEARNLVEGLFFFNSCVNPFLYAFNYRSLYSNSEQPGKENCSSKDKSNISLTLD